MKVAPYLFFDGRAEEAIEFYGRVLGAKVEMMMRFKDNPSPGMNPPGSENMPLSRSAKASSCCPMATVLESLNSVDLRSRFMSPTTPRQRASSKP